jgi:HEAT repeat protein
LRIRAVEALFRLGSAAEAAIPALVQVLRDEEPARIKAAEVLGHLGPAAKAAVPALRELLKAVDPEARIQAALALWRIERRTEDTIPVLVDALHNPTASRLGSTSSSPSRFGTSTRPIVIPLCQQAADALGQMGPAARAAVPALTEALKDAHVAAYRPAFALALAKIDPAAAKAAVPALIQVLDRKGHAVYLPEAIAGTARKDAATALGQMGADAREAVPALREAIMDPDQAVQSEATAALKKIEAALERQGSGQP